LAYPPERIICLTEETVEALYLMGREQLIAGVTGYAVRPARVRKEKPRVAAFTSANTDKILALKPDLVLAFSDLQADIAAELIRHGIAVHCFNQRCVEGIFDMVLTLGALVDARDEAAVLVAGWREKIAALEAGGAGRQAEGLLRGVGRTADHRHRLGVGADRGGRRRGLLRALANAAGSEGPHHHFARRDKRGAGYHHRVVVRQEVPAGQGCGTARLGGDTGGARRAAARDQVAIDIAAGAGGAERRA
jgi:hypothetical protein